MAFNVQSPTAGGLPANIECRVAKTEKKDWNCCQLKQYCAKVHELDTLARDPTVHVHDITGTQKYDIARAEGDQGAKDFRKDWNNDPNKTQNPTKNKFYHECAVKSGQIGPEMQADHVHEIQRGGHPTGTNYSNLKWLDSSVNGSIGSSLEQLPHNPTYVKADCCPAGGAGKPCHGKTDKQKVLPKSER